MWQYSCWRSLLFRLDPEKAHEWMGVLAKGIQACPSTLAFLAQRYAFFDSRLEMNLWGLPFSSPIGLAAGFDKNAEMIPFLATLGFSHIEIGTVTPMPQEGNPKPRIFRLESDQSLQNAMGFNNKGQDAIAESLRHVTPFVIPIGVNIGKNKLTPNEQSLQDYEHLLRTLSPYASYITINLSSPNTPDLRDLQNEAFIKDLFDVSKGITHKPILLKIAPDMEIQYALSLATKALECGASGIIATNTTIDYSLSPHAKPMGGISGALLKRKSFEILQALGREFHKQTVLVSVGGVDDAVEAYRRIKAGASLIQVYTALIYQGPAFVRALKSDLITLLQQDGYSHISEAIGADFSC